MPLYMDRNTPSVPSGELNGKESLIKKIKGGESGETRKQIEDALVELRLGGRSCVLCRNPEGPSEDPHLRKQTDLCIYMDAMCFGMGMNCVQATFSPKNLAAARYLYDQLIVLAPLLLSVGAGNPEKTRVRGNFWLFRLAKPFYCLFEKEFRKDPRAFHADRSAFRCDSADHRSHAVPPRLRRCH